jgi:hypothetical protein
MVHLCKTVRDGVWYRRSVIRTDNGNEALITNGFLFGRCQGAQGDVRIWPTEIANAANRARVIGDGDPTMTPIADVKDLKQ